MVEPGATGSANGELARRAQHAAAWLAARQAGDGRWTVLGERSIESQYKVPLAFSIVGDLAAAERSLSRIRKDYISRDGDLKHRIDEWHVDVHYPYTNSWVLWGASRTSRVDVTTPVLRGLKRLQDRDSGGFLSAGIKGASWTGRRTDTMSSGIAGIALLAAGASSKARRVSEWLDDLLSQQPEPSRRLYTSIENGRLVTSFNEDEAFWRVIDANEPDQCWYAAGLPLAFSVLMWQATRRRVHADRAERILRFLEGCVNPWSGPSSGKAGWAASMLYRATGEARYEAIAREVAATVSGSQLPSGMFAWGAEPGAADPAEPTMDDIDITAEYIVWLSLIGANLEA